MSEEIKTVQISAVKWARGHQEIVEDTSAEYHFGWKVYRISVFVDPATGTSPRYWIGTFPTFIAAENFCKLVEQAQHGESKPAPKPTRRNRTRPVKKRVPVQIRTVTMSLEPLTAAGEFTRETFDDSTLILESDIRGFIADAFFYQDSLSDLRAYEPDIADETPANILRLEKARVDLLCALLKDHWPEQTKRRS